MDDTKHTSLTASITSLSFEGDSDIDQLAQSTSPQLAMLLLKNLPGIEVKTGHEIHPDHFVSKAIGFENAQRLAEYLAGDTLYVPKRHPALQASLVDQIPKLIDAGLTRPEIARRLKITQRHVRRLISQMGLSGKTLARRSTKLLPAPSESGFNGGLTGVSASFAAPDNSEASHDAVCVIQTKFGIYTPQPQKDQS